MASVNERPVRLTVADDLRRSLGTVLFRLWFAAPFLLWLVLWSVAVPFVALASWVATLLEGRTPGTPHRFLARYLRYATHVNAYLHLAAEPLPRFNGKPGYPIDLEVDPPARQNRWSVGFRLLLVLPALALLTALAGAAASVYGLLFPSLNSTGIGVLGVATVFAWFAAIVHGRTPRGLRDLIAYALSYWAQVWAYLLLLTDRYPSSDPLTAIGPPPVRDDPVQLEVREDLRRSRLTVFFRLPLAAPHLVWLALWGIAALFAAVANWFATLFVGVSPRPLHRFLAAYVRYQLHVGAYLYLVGNLFPGFVGGESSYPIELRVAPRAPQNRWRIFFRALLVAPALLLAGVYGALALTVAVLGWFAALITGRMPLGLRNAGALALRYMAQTYGYLLLVTDAYPYSGPCLAPESAPTTSQATAPPPPAPPA
jgi:Domain of unknown function (DUF4389)